MSLLGSIGNAVGGAFGELKEGASGFFQSAGSVVKETANDFAGAAGSRASVWFSDLLDDRSQDDTYAPTGTSPDARGNLTTSDPRIGDTSPAASISASLPTADILVLGGIGAAVFLTVYLVRRVF